MGEEIEVMPSPRYPVTGVPENPHDLGESIFQLKTAVALMESNVATITEKIDTMATAHAKSQFSRKDIVNSLLAGVAAAGVMGGALVGGVSFYVSSVVGSQIEPLKTMLTTSTNDFNSRFQSMSTALTSIREEQLSRTHIDTRTMLRLQALEMKTGLKSTLEERP